MIHPSCTKRPERPFHWTRAAMMAVMAGLTLNAAPLQEMPAKVKVTVEDSPRIPAPKASAFGLKVARNVGLPAPDLAESIAEDAAVAAESEAKAPRRVGIKRPLVPVEAADSEWNLLPDGSRVWVGRFESVGAQGIRLHFSGVQLPAGAVLIAYDEAQPDRVEGPFDPAYLGGRDSFWSSTVFASTVVVEAHVPAGAGLARFQISELTHNYRSPQSDQAKNAGACEIDFSCELANWGTTGNAVSGIGAVAQNGSIFCTGCLLNDQNPAASTDYYLTANHCINGQSEASTLEFYWMYQTPSCNGAEPNLATVPRTRGGADLLSRRPRGTGVDQNDHSFLRLRGTIPAGVTYAGWSVNAPAAGEDITCIHHPDGDYKRISHGTVRTAGSTANYWNILWTPGRGVTEPGSSGSPIFNAQKQVIGQLFGGPSACSNTNPADQNDDFGRFAITYNYVSAWLLNENPPPPPTAPTNDVFATPQLLTGGSGSVTGDSSVATRQAGEPQIVSNPGGSSLWYRWTAPAAGAVVFETVGSSFDTLLGVYRGTSLTALTVVAQNDDIASDNTASRVSFAAVAGTTYLIAVDGYNGNNGDVVLRWTGPGGVVNNDNFVNASAISGATGLVNGSNISFSRETGEPTHQIAGTPAANVGQRSAWWNWTAPASGSVTFTTAGSSFDTVMGVYTGTAVGSLTTVSLNDDVSEQVLTSSVTFNAVAGATYRIAVDGYRLSSGTQREGNIVLNWSSAIVPPPVGNNDAFTNAVVLTGATGTSSGSNNSYTREAGEPNHANGDGVRSAWWTWTAPASGSVTFNTEGSGFDTVLAVYTGNSMGALVLIASDDDSGAGASSLVQFTATAGTAYRIAVDGFNGASGSIALNWSQGGVVPPVEGKPDLIVWAPALLPRTEFRTFAANDCAVNEGCGIVGRRRLLTFDTQVRNQGTADVRLGAPGPSNTNFVWDPCHGHYHWLNYANYRLVGTNGSIATGRKVGFCLLDSIHWSTTNGPATSRYDCQNQGISAGWGDVYGRNLSCQWIDITDVPDGPYFLEIEVDPNNQFDELDETNNVARVPVVIGNPVVPSNDSFGTARLIHGAAGLVHGNNTGGSVQAGEPPLGGGASVWFRWTAPCNGTAVIDTEGTGFDTILGVYVGSSVTALGERAVNDDVGNGRYWSRVSFQATAGTEYQILFDGYSGQDSGPYRLNWSLQGGSCPPTPRPLPVERPTVAGAFAVDFFGQTGETYAMDVSEDLSPTGWVRLLTTTGEGRSMTFTDNSANQHARRYYRIVQINPTNP